MLTAVWLTNSVSPGRARTLHYEERFRDDLEYRQLLLDSGAVDSNGKLARWTKDEQGKDCFKDFEAIVAQEREEKGVQKGKGKGKGKSRSSAPSTPSPSSRSWSSSSWNWRGSSWR